MKFKFKPAAPWPKRRTKRTVTRFLWLPKWINDEMRWLETATWEEEVAYWVNGITGERMHWSWDATAWVD